MLLLPRQLIQEVNMNKTLFRRHMVQSLLFPLLAILTLAGNMGCPAPGGDVILPDFVTLELVNETPFEVDPGVFINGSQLNTGLLFPAPDELVLDVDCFPGDLIEIDAILLDPFDPAFDVLSANVPVLEEGFEFLCGDIITIFYTQDAFGTFFVEVAVNDVLLGF